VINSLRPHLYVIFLFGLFVLTDLHKCSAVNCFLNEFAAFFAVTALTWDPQMRVVWVCVAVLLCLITVAAMVMRPAR
jgi:hypothetical protein